MNLLDEVRPGDEASGALERVVDVGAEHLQLRGKAAVDDLGVRVATRHRTPGVRLPKVFCGLDGYGGATSWGSIEVDEVEADAIAVVVVAGLPKTEPVMSWSVACVVMQNWEAREMSRGGSAIVVATEGAVEGVAGLLVTSCSRSGRRGGGGP
ncbi:unnamed protein product [Miscanthus lutarioriparius]|uniref:Uncharacterized protein n=1 Tax=Miscanthus lutarioriparius TaxID=422564 RepID=A0A811SQL2_9POAL|nr:unnamed protein product [Miscanthus lutarioriparius]